MTQQEAENMFSILKRRNLEKKTVIENSWKFEKQKFELDRKHTLKRLEQRLLDAQFKLIEARDKLFKEKTTSDNWKLLAIDVNMAKAAVREIHTEREELNRYYQSVFRDLIQKRDHALREIATDYGKERARIMDKVEYPHREEKVQYWRDKYYQLKEKTDRLESELNKLKTEAA